MSTSELGPWMSTSEPLHVAFVWHMHQPYYRGARSNAFEMPWARLHALKDYLNMVELLAVFPDLHQTFNLVPSLVEQLEDYASGDFSDVYWEHTLKPAAELEPGERAFVVERMCEHPDHPRARSHPRYLELAEKRRAHASQGWEACARAFSDQDLLDLQVWFNLAWFNPTIRESKPLQELVTKGRNYREEDKVTLAQVQQEVLGRVLPAYRAAARKGQIELTTSLYFHPILPLLTDSDSARISCPNQVLPARRFAHPEDALEQVLAAIEKHRRVFGGRPRGMWCSEQAVGEAIISLLTRAGLEWTISDETVLARSLAGAVPTLPPEVRPAGAGTGGAVVLSPACLYQPYRLAREQGELSIIFRDHTLSDLIGFAYQSWDSRDAARDLVRRLLDIRKTLVSEGFGSGKPARQPRPFLVTIALDGENAWEYYPRDGRDFLCYLYELLAREPALRCVTVSEHLEIAPPVWELGWLHTGSWIGGDLRTWSGDPAHNTAWTLLHDARDLVAGRRSLTAHNCGTPVATDSHSRGSSSRANLPTSNHALLEAKEGLPEPDPQVLAAWCHVLIAEGSDWFWWFGEHHHTELDYVWDQQFRFHLQEVYHCLGEPVPPALLSPILAEAEPALPKLPERPLMPIVDGLITSPTEWEGAGRLVRELSSTMQRAEGTPISEVRFGWHNHCLCVLVIPGSSAALEGLDIQIRVTHPGQEDDPVIDLTLTKQGKVRAMSIRSAYLAGKVEAAWREVLEVVVPLDRNLLREDGIGLVVRVGRGGLNEHTFHLAGLTSTDRGEP